MDVADIGASTAERIGASNGLGGPQRPDAAEGAKNAAEARKLEAKRREARKRKARERLGAATARALGDYEVRRALDPAYTQLTLNASGGPLADERVRRAVAQAIDRDELAEKALAGTGLPDDPLGSHLRMADQDGYRDNSGAFGSADLDSAQSLLGRRGLEDRRPRRAEGRRERRQGGRRAAEGREGREGRRERRTGPTAGPPNRPRRPAPPTRAVARRTAPRPRLPSCG